MFLKNLLASLFQFGVFNIQLIVTLYNDIAFHLNCEKAVHINFIIHLQQLLFINVIGIMHFVVINM